MDVTAIINNQEIEFWSWRGTVSAIWDTPKTTDGAAPSTEVRLIGPQDEKRTLAFPQQVKLSEEAVVSLLYARRAEDQKGPMIGVVNHTSGQKWLIAKDARPVQYNHPLPLRLVKKIDRYGLLGIAFILSALTAFGLYVQTEVPFSLPNWAAIWVAELAVLWVLALIANRRQKAIDEAFLQEADTVLRRLSYEPIEPETKDEDAAA